MAIEFTPTYFNERRKTKTFASFSAFKSLRFKKTITPSESGLSTKESTFKPKWPATAVKAASFYPRTTNLPCLNESIVEEEDEQMGPDGNIIKIYNSPRKMLFDSPSLTNAQSRDFIKLSNGHSCSSNAPWTPSTSLRGCSSSSSNGTIFGNKTPKLTHKKLFINNFTNFFQQKLCDNHHKKSFVPEEDINKLGQTSLSPKSKTNGAVLYGSSPKSFFGEAGSSSCRSKQKKNFKDQQPRAKIPRQQTPTSMNGYSRSFTNLNKVCLLTATSATQSVQSVDSNNANGCDNVEFSSDGRHSAEPRINFWVNRKMGANLVISPNVASIINNSPREATNIISNHTNHNLNIDMSDKSSFTNKQISMGMIVNPTQQQPSPIQNLSSTDPHDFSLDEKMELETLLNEFGENSEFLDTTYVVNGSANHSENLIYNNQNQNLPHIKTNGSLPRDRKVGVTSFISHHQPHNSRNQSPSPKDPTSLSQEYHLSQSLELVMEVKQKLVHIGKLKFEILKQIDNEKCEMAKERESELEGIVQERKEIEEYQSISQEYLKSLERQRDEKMKNLGKLKRNLAELDKTDTEKRDLSENDTSDLSPEMNIDETLNLGVRKEETAQSYEDLEFEIIEMESKIEDERERINQNLLEQKSRFTQKYQYIIQEKFSKIDDAKLMGIKQMQAHLELLNHEEKKLKQIIQLELLRMGYDDGSSNTYEPIKYQDINVPNMSVCGMPDDSIQEEQLRRRASEEIRSFWRNISPTNPNNPNNTTPAFINETCNFALQRESRNILKFVHTLPNQLPFNDRSHPTHHYLNGTADSRMESCNDTDIQPRPNNNNNGLDVRIEQVMRSLNEIKLKTTFNPIPADNHIYNVHSSTEHSDPYTPIVDMQTAVNNTDLLDPESIDNNELQDDEYDEDINIYETTSNSIPSFTLSTSTNCSSRRGQHYKTTDYTVKTDCEPKPLYQLTSSCNGPSLLPNKDDVNTFPPKMKKKPFNSTLLNLNNVYDFNNKRNGLKTPKMFADDTYLVDKNNLRNYVPLQDKALPLLAHSTQIMSSNNNNNSLPRGTNFPPDQDPLSRQVYHPNLSHFSVYGTTTRSKTKSNGKPPRLGNNLLSNGTADKLSQLESLSNNQEELDICTTRPQLLSISHTYPGDLYIYLTSSNETYNLYLNRNANAINITKFCARGYLYKLGYKLKIWKRRWFVFDISKRHVTYFVDKSEQKPKGIIYFQAIEDAYTDHTSSYKPPVQRTSFCLKTAQKLFYLCSTKREVSDLWVAVLSIGIESNNVVSMVAMPQHD